MRWEKLDLWPNQKAALEHCERYLRRPERAALVQMPTGSGKTGVIATICRLVSSSGLALVVSPSKGLASQLRADIATDFWQKIRAPDSWRPTGVLTLLPSLADKNTKQIEAARGKGIVLVGTLVSLLEIKEQEPDSYQALLDHARVVIVDEGHREPATQWAAAVRELGKPTILFSATPYRNDLKLFDVNDKWIHFLSFKQALDDHLIRDVSFEALGSDGSARDFAARLVSFCKQGLADKKLRADTKVIVRCASEQTVRAVTNELQRIWGREGVLGLHENFAGDKLPLVDHVQDIRARPERLLVHQYKLIEGIDDPRCALLAVFEDFDNERQLVQQIGRVIRHPNPRSAPAPKAVVLADNAREIKGSWSAYRLFDKVCQEAGGKPPVRNSVDTLIRLLKAYPDAEYYRGQFRKLVDFSDESIDSEIRVPLSCIVYRLGRGFSLADLGARLRLLIEEEERTLVHSSQTQDDRCLAYLGLTAAESPILSRSLFPLLGLEATVLVRSGNYLFFHDSGRLSIDSIVDGRRLDAESLKGLIPETPNARVTTASLLNCDIGPNAVRARTISAASLADSVPSMGDEANFISLAIGRVEPGIRRYLGFTRSRVRQNDGEVCSLSDFARWSDRVAATLDAKVQPAAFFGRFATPTGVPPDPRPQNILLEATSIEGSFIDQDKKAISVNDSCAEVNIEPNPPEPGYDYSFVVGINGAPHQSWIRWDAERQKYSVLSPTLDQYREADNSKGTLTHRLNAEQDFRIIPMSPLHFYAGGQFYDIRERFARGGAAELLLQLLTPIPQLGAMGSEKGRRDSGVTHDSWDPQSVFHLIDDAMVARRGGAFGTTFSHVVCDDMGPEVADFIGIAEGGRATVFVQAKCKRDAAQVSASALYDVCAQTTKNLGFLRFGGLELSDRARKWMRNWAEDYQVRPRIRKGPTGGREFVDDLGQTLRRATTRREMWLVLGQVLSRNELGNALSARHPAAHAIQTFYLLMATYNACKSVGVDFRVFCSP